MDGALIAPAPRRNLLLEALSAGARERIFPHLELVSLRSGQSVKEPGHSLRHVYFPLDCVVSLLCTLESGAMAEVSLVGNEGLVEIACFLGGDSTPHAAVVVSSGTCYRLLAHRLEDEFNRRDETMWMLLRYTQSLMTQVAQTAACNQRHTIAQQLCRWLLLALDRVGGDRMEMTQEMIAHMLGVRREGVCEAAVKLQQAGAIFYHHGHITVLDRSLLEQRSCECYRVVRTETSRLVASVPGLEPHESAPRDLITEFPPMPATTRRQASDIVVRLPVRRSAARIAQPG